MSDVKEIINPTEMFSVIRTKQLMIENKLSTSECEGHNPPLQFYSSMSMFKFVVINEDKKPTTATLRVSEFTGVKLKSRFAYNESLRLSMQPKKEETPKSLAYTVKITAGTFKGKTPAQIILEDPTNNQKRLNDQYLWLKEQISKNPKFAESNKRQMEAIVDAGNLFKQGKLNADDAQDVNSFVIYESGMRPQMRKQRADGMCPIREMKILWNFGDNYPVEIRISNYWAPVTKKENGMLNVQAKQKTDVQNNSMVLTDLEWMNAIEIIETNMRTFENINADKLYKVARNSAIANYEKAKQQGNQ